MIGLIAALIIFCFGMVGVLHMCRHFGKKLLIRRASPREANDLQTPSFELGQHERLPWPVIKQDNKVVALLFVLVLPLLLLVIFSISLFQSNLARAAGTLTVEILAAYNLVVDSNVESPSTYAPSAATVAGKFCNTGDAPLTDIQGYIGDYKGTPSTSTPGLYPERYSTDPAFQAQHPHLVPSSPVTYSFTHIGGRAGLADARRYVGALAPGECRVQYWHFTYPRRGNPDNTGNAVWGATNDPNDDLWLEFDVWATSFEGSNANATWRATMRNEISAMANKMKLV